MSAHFRACSGSRKLKASTPRPVAGRQLDRAAVGAGHPHRRVRLLARLGHHVAARHREALALVAGVGLHHHHVGDLLGRLERQRLLAAGVDAVAPQLEAGGALADAEVDPAVGDEVHHRHRLGGAGGVVVVRDDLADAEADADALGLGRQRREEHVGGRAVGVLLEEVVLDRPGVVDAQLVGQDDLLGGLLDDAVLRLVVPRLGQLELVHHPELHARIASSRIVGRLVLDAADAAGEAGQSQECSTGSTSSAKSRIEASACSMGMPP